jgi:hypothetical protein
LKEGESGEVQAQLLYLMLSKAFMQSVAEKLTSQKEPHVPLEGCIQIRWQTRN